jgi:hypothetical protein
MKCAEFETLLCDYLDGTLEAEARQALEAHQSQCAACAGLASDAVSALAFLEGVEPVQAPPELVTRILYQTQDSGAVASPAKPGVLDWLRGLMQPVLQPKFAMGMAMTILSFSMVGRIMGVNQRQLTMADLDPVKVVAALDAKVWRAYDRAVKYYENLRLVYEIQSRMQEWSMEAEQERKAQGGGEEIHPGRNGKETNGKGTNQP